MIPRYTGSAWSAVALALLLAWAPIPAGSITPKAELIFRLAGLGTLLLAVLPAGEAWSRARLLPVAALAGVAALGLVQSCRWPAGLVSFVSGEHARLYAQAAALMEKPASAAAVPLSLDSSVSRSSALSWLVAAALLAAVLVAGRRPGHRRWLLLALLAAALTQLGYGLIRVGTSAPGGLSALFRPEGRLQGTYANPNHLSLLLEITMAVVAAWAWWALKSRADGTARPRIGAIGPLCLWLLLLVGVVLTGSRAGLAAAVVGCALQASFMLLRLRGRGSRLAVVGLLFALAALMVVGTRLEIRRYERVSLYESNLRSRVLSTGPALELWRRFPVTGTGLGTFEDAFPMVSPPELTEALWNRAHNDPLELLVTGGVVGLGLGVLAAVALLVPILRATRRERSGEDQAAGLAAVGVLGAAGFHELLDFGLVIPANHLALLVVLGVGAAAGLSPSARRARE